VILGLRFNDLKFKGEVLCEKVEFFGVFHGE